MGWVIADTVDNKSLVLMKGTKGELYDYYNNYKSQVDVVRLYVVDSLEGVLKSKPVEPKPKPKRKNSK